MTTPDLKPSFERYVGIDALQAVFTAEAEALAGPKGRQQRERTHHHWGRTATELTFGGRRIQVARPRSAR